MGPWKWNLTWAFGFITFLIELGASDMYPTHIWSTNKYNNKYINRHKTIISGQTI